MKGHLRRRGENSWELKFDAGRDPATGKRKIRYQSFRGTKRQAQTRLAELIAAVSGGSYVEPRKVTVAEHLRTRIDQWEAAGDITARTAQRYRQLNENQIAPHIGQKVLQQLRPFDIEVWHTALRTAGRVRGAGGVAARTIGHAHRLLAKALGEAVRNDWLIRNVAAAQPAPKVAAEEMAIIRSGEMPALLAALQGSPVYALGVAGLFTGMRLGELLALRWADVDLDRASIRVSEALEETKAHGIRRKPPKTKAGRRAISLPDLVVGVLREHRRAQLALRLQLGLGKPSDQALVFPVPDGSPQSPSAASRQWGLAAAAIGRPDITFHALRHSHASQLIDAGVDVVTISRRLGHANPNVTLTVYSHLFRKDDSKAAAAINAALTAEGQPR